MSLLKRRKMESDAILITQLNDFIFCPASIYFHGLYGEVERNLFQSEAQINGSAAHKTIDAQQYSSRQDIMQGCMVYSGKYNILGKIDIYDSRRHKLIERKRQIKRIYDGYIFQTYAECVCLREAGYIVESIVMHSMVDNRDYCIALPEDDIEMFLKFEKVIEEMKQFKLEKFVQNNSEKCRNCIYEPACDRSLL